MFFFSSSSFLDEKLPLLGGRRRISGCRKFLQGLEPIDREDWSRSNFFKKCFMICKVSTLLFELFEIKILVFTQEFPGVSLSQLSILQPNNHHPSL